jgi:hypothetical protein
MNLPYTIASQDLADPDELRLNRLFQIIASQITTSSTALTLQFSGASGFQGSSYSASLIATGGTSPYTYSVLGILPTGLSLNLVTGVIMGVPSATGTFNFVGQVTDSTGATATLAISIVISTPGSSPLVVYTTTLALPTTVISVAAPAGVNVLLVVQITQSSAGGDQISWDVMFVPLPPVNLNLDANAQSVFNFAAIGGNWRFTGMTL